MHDEEIELERRFSTNSIKDFGVAMLGYFAQYCFYPIVERYLGRDVRTKWKILHQYYKNSFAVREKLIRKRVIQQVKFANANVPYYNDLFKNIGFDPEKLDHDFKYFFDIPLLDKEIIQEHGDRMLNVNSKISELIKCKTGGSTGISMLVYYDKEAVDWTSATNMFVLELAGRKRHMKELHLASRYPETFPLKDRLKEHVKCFAMNRSNIYSHSFDDNELDFIWRKIKAKKPFLIQGHPSTLYMLSCYLKKKKYDAKNIIRIFESTGEVLDKKKRTEIEKVFGCKVVNRYGNAEFGVIAYENSAFGEKLQVIDYMLFPEALKCNSGSLNEIVATNLTNNAMPLIRYRCGDFGDLIKNEYGYFYEKVEGRIHDIINIGGKIYPTHYLQDLLDRVGGILEFQVQQIAQKQIKLIIVYDELADQQAIQNKLISWWDNNVVFESVKLNEMKRIGWRGKFRYLIPEPNTR